MSRRNRAPLPLSRRPVPEAVRARIRSPLAVVLGSPAEVIHLLHACDGATAVCYQMDLYQAERLRDALAKTAFAATIEVLPDLWDLPADFQSAVYMPARGGERELKIDMIEQAFHILRPGGSLTVWSSYETDPFFPALLKKVFGRVHENRSKVDAVFWGNRAGDRPRRRHEVTFQARILNGAARRFLSRPGVFTYGRCDDGARALVETCVVDAGDRVLDLGCGCGVVGVFAAQRAGSGGRITFVDSNVRAAALAEHNARTNGVASFDVVASSAVQGLKKGSFDVILANPPYIAEASVARMFIERAHGLLNPRGRLFLVTKQPGPVAEMIEEVFGAVEAMMRRGYTVLCG